MFIHLNNKEGNRILDVGCGRGLLGIASEPFLSGSGRYVGIDVVKSHIDFCRSHYTAPDFEFIHFNVCNPVYAPYQETLQSQWPLDSSTFDLVTALSVWTHLSERDALFYMREVNRVLKPGGKAIITVFLLDELYERSLSMRSNGLGRYHMTSQKKWIFDQPAYGSSAWFCRGWARVPESAIAITNAALHRLTSIAELELIQYYHGNWKEVPGVFFQDVLVFRKLK
jgi:SAM-dependent methyltransferase